MKDLEQLKASILSDLKDDLSKQLAVATKEQEDELNQANAHAAAWEMSKKAQVKQAAKSQFEKDRQSILNGAKRETLALKQSLLESVFQQAYDLMAAWSGDTFLSFVQGALKPLAGKEVSLVLGEVSKQGLSPQTLAQLGELAHLKDQTLAKKAGFVLEVDGLEYNYLFDALLKDLQAEFAGELAGQAFGA